MNEKLTSFREYLKSVGFTMRISFQVAPWESAITFIVYSITAVLSYATAYYLGLLVNSLTEAVKNPQLLTGVLWIFILYAVTNSLPNFLSGIRLYLDKRWTTKFQTYMELEVMKKRAEIDIAHYENPKFQDLIQRAFHRSFWPVLELADTQFEVYQGLVALLFGSILATQFSWKIYMLMFLTSLPKFLSEYKYGYNVWSIWNDDSPEKRRFADLRQHFNNRAGVVELKLQQSSGYMLRWSEKILKNFDSNLLNEEKRKVFTDFFVESLSVAGFVIASYLILRDVLAGTILIGSMIFLLRTLANIQSSASNLLTNLARQEERHLIVRDIIAFFKTEPLIKVSPNPIKLNLEAPPEIVFDNVSFRYPHAKQWSLRNLSLKIKAGEKVGLVGDNGAGKTTFIKLLSRIYDPTEGSILVNGYDLRNLDLKEWWSYLGVMFQDYMNYDFVAKEAIAISRTDRKISQQEVEKSAMMAQADSFIQEWDKKYNEPIGVEFEGVEPSKGQRQRLAIARIMYRNPFIMILDEPTASVDAESEAKIFESLEDLSDLQTAIFISHDFSTIRECDHVLVLDHGKLLEEGNHDNLIKKPKGLYARLFKLQAERFK